MVMGYVPPYALIFFFMMKFLLTIFHLFWQNKRMTLYYSTDERSGGQVEGSKSHLPCKGIQYAVLQLLCVQAGTLWYRCQNEADKQIGEETDHQAWRIVVNDSCCTWKSGFCEILQETFLAPLLLGIFINDLEEQMWNTLFKSVDDTKPGVAANTLDGRTAIQSNGPRECGGEIQQEISEISKGWRLSSAPLVLLNPLQLCRQSLPGWVAAQLRKCWGLGHGVREQWSCGKLSLFNLEERRSHHLLRGCIPNRVSPKRSPFLSEVHGKTMRDSSHNLKRGRFWLHMRGEKKIT